MPGFSTVSDGAEYAVSDSIIEGDSDDDEDDVSTQSDSHVESILGSISCFAHTLLLCVKWSECISSIHLISEQSGSNCQPCEEIYYYY